ncbi:MAG: hypothetical protein O7A71_02220 [Chloroflexi bacterium]|jgi:hypothetical protein|nr:hypothetical protein [Chloroflexota bacterium]
MTQSSIDPQSRVRYADDLIAQTADQLAALLKEAALQLRPFPPFPGAFFTYGVEVEAEGVLDKNIGCVVVSQEGDLKELQISLDAEEPGFGPGDPVSMRDEHLVDLELTPHDRLLFAYQGLRVISDLLREARAAAPE